MPIATGSQQVRRAPRQGAEADGRGLMMVRSGTPEGHRSDRLIRPGPMGLRISPRAREAAASRARPRGIDAERRRLDQARRVLDSRG